MKLILISLLLVGSMSAYAIPVSDEHLGNQHTPEAERYRNEARDRASGPVCHGVCGVAGYAAGAAVGKVYGPYAGGAAAGATAGACAKKCK